jgi:hypothetical protein
MTRINVAIPPAELTMRHLLAEHREIKRIPRAFHKAYNGESIVNVKDLSKSNYWNI